jgi:hypothetical protein
MLLVVGQVLLISHVVVHQLEEAIAPDNDHCCFCEIGNHASAPQLPPPVVPIFVYTNVVFFAFVASCVAGFPLPLLRARGPPRFQR